MERSFILTDSEIYQQYLQKLEIFTKLILWLIKNVRIIQQLQVQPGNLFISDSGQIYLNDSLDESSSKSYDSNEILIQKYTQAIINIFDLDIFWLLFDHISFARKLSQKAKVDTLIRNYFSTIDFEEEMWNIAAYQELERIFNRLLKLKTINQKYETISLQISSNSLDNYEFKWYQWIFVKDNIQILKENKNIYNIKNIRYFDKQCVPSQLFNMFGEQFYQIFKDNNNLPKEVLIQQLDYLIEQGLMIRQDKYIHKVKELTLQKIDELYDLNTLQLKPVNLNQKNTYCSCFNPTYELTHYQIFSTIAYYYILMVILDEQNRQTDTIQDKCLFEELFGFQNKIIQDQHNLKMISYEFTDCELLTKALQSQIDFFNFKANQNILTLNILSYEKQLPDICKQLSQNKNKINSLKVVIPSSFVENQCPKNEKAKKLLKKKIPFLVKLL